MKNKRDTLYGGRQFRLAVLFLYLFVSIVMLSAVETKAGMSLPTGSDGKIRTSYLNANGYSYNDLDVKKDMTLVVDENCTIGELYLGTNNLTIEGNGNAILTVAEISTATGGDKGSLTMKSGRVHVNCVTPATFPSYALYIIDRFTMSGGELTVMNGARSFAVYCCKSLHISGGKLNIETDQGTANHITGLAVSGSGMETGKAAFSMSGGELNIAVSGKDPGTGVTGLSLSSGCKGEITGGKVNVSAAYTTGSGIEQYGISGTSSSSLLISGGNIYAAGYSAGISTVPLEVRGDAQVTAKATGKTYAGIHVEKLKLSDHPIVRAEGGEKAISAVNMDPLPNTLAITIPKNGMISKLPGGSARYAVVASTGYPAKEVEIASVDSPGTAIITLKEKITIVKAPASIKVKAKKNRITVSWKKIKKNKKTKKLRSQIKGIEIQYSTDRSFPKEKTVSKTIRKDKTKYVVKGLKRKTKYYIRVRYTNRAGGYSRWSKVKRARTK